MSDGPIHSTGRGGAGNIGHDPVQYHDGAIVREGIQGQGNGDFSTGRGGAGNMTKSPLIRPADGSPRTSSDFIPEDALRKPQDNFHTGRGGEGNVYKEKYGGHSHSPDRKGAIEKVKHALHLDGRDKREGSPLATETKPEN
ncbi:uncharacterized protein N0V89_011478 [Didymosphaeria variabile]|uniref:Uncharacterized protein n=1 Tax=Didymosphaeria variabile TaxID=1932322 RepID=A0A9W9C6F8_9PLEO|nr:uncharacterized protein N0V89_011478 [Didymosphaeria variabile]KAJ4345348.1 hypothetical protein N0V89_011478 [Didymosphaeria variabile]